MLMMVRKISKNEKIFSLSAAWMYGAVKVRLNKR